MLKNITRDLPAGLAVFIVAVPLCLGIAVASGAPLMSGLIAGIVWGIVVWLLSKSPLSVSGPAAGLVAIVVSAIWKLWFDQFLVAVILAWVFQIIFGLLRASKINRYVPVSVIKGMLAAIGMTLIIKQVPTLLWIIPTLFSWTNPLANISYNVSIIGIASLFVLIIWNKYLAQTIKTIPWSLIAVICGVIISIIYIHFLPLYILQPNQLVGLPTNIHGILDIWNGLTHANIAHYLNPQIRTTAITIALVASIETILSINALDKLDHRGHHTPLNHELVAQGVGNIISWILWGLPITSVIVRSSVNLHAGGKTKLSTIIHGFLILWAILFAAHYINMIPMAVLAAILVVTWYQLTSPSKFIEKYKAWWWEFIPFIVTFITILSEDLLVGVLAGIVVYYIILATQNKLRTNHQDTLSEDVD